MEENENKKVIVEIQKYKALQNILNEPKSIRRLVFLVLVLCVILFGGISIILISLKTLYPYNDITTNVMGATSIRNEEKEVTYWLFNTAELWANSGIQVKAGQTITVRASGKKNTAIHHLVEDTYKNSTELKDGWVGSEGVPDKRSERDKYRGYFRILPNFPQDALIMQVAQRGEPVDRPTDSKNQFVFIGEQAESIHILNDGFLCFAVNDIVLDDFTITRMLRDVAHGSPIARLDKAESQKDTTICQSMQLFRDKIYKDRIDFKDDSVYYEFLKILGVNSTNEQSAFYCTWKEDQVLRYTPTRFGASNQDMTIIELYGYFMSEYRTPWFDDNVGSFLIVVEKSE